MTCVDAWYSTSSDEEDPKNLRIKRKILRDSSNPLELPSALFVNYFRLNKNGFKYILEKIEGQLKMPVNSVSVLPVIKLAAVLRFLADGSYQKGVGNDFNVGVAQSTFSKILKQVLNVLEKEICSEFIKFPESVQEKEEIKLSFYTKYGFPGVIGCVDGTHIKLIFPSTREKHLYYNRKGFYSINVMLICDHKQRIRYVDANNVGSSHDSFNWNSSVVDRKLQEKFEAGDSNTWLLGDSGYPLKPYLITPFRSSVNGINDAETQFNKRHCRARNIIERTIGLIKNTFRCTLGARELHYKPSKCAQIVNVCCALHNVRIHFQPHTFEDEVAVESTNIDESDVAPDTPDSNGNEAARRIRNQIMNSINTLLNNT